MNPTASQNLRMIALLFAMIAIAPAASAFGAPQDSAPTTLPSFEVTEWSILMCDPIQGRINAIGTVGSTLPGRIETVRPAAKTRPDAPSPIGIIRFTGQTDQKIKVRLTAPAKGVFCAAWPPAHLRSPEVIWSDLTLAAVPGQREPLGADHWLAPLQSGSHSYLAGGDMSEAFLLYDLEMPFTVPLLIYPGKAGADGIQVENFGGAALHDLVIYRPPHDSTGWTTVSLPELPPPKLSGASVAAATEISFAPPANSADRPEELVAADWKERLRPWDLSSADAALIINELQSHALDERQMTVVFRLDESVLNRLLPLEITPAPAQIRRLALVIVRNIDPGWPALIDQLIAQLGDADWHKRETATRLLAGYAPAADSKLRSALLSKDAEVALRAERLLARDSAR